MHRKKHILLLFLFTLTFLLNPVSVHAAGSVTLSLSPASPEVGEMAYLKIVCINIDKAVTKPTTVPGFDIKFFVSSRSGYKTFYDGKNSYSAQFQEYTTTLRATKEGTYSFGPIEVGGVKSNKIDYTIKKASSQKAPSQQPINDPYQQFNKPTLVKEGGKELFLMAEASNPNPYVEEAVTYTVKLYSSFAGTQWLGYTSDPVFENAINFRSDDVDHDLNQVAILNGKEYKTAVLMRFILYPTKSGKAVLEGNRNTFSVKQLKEYLDGFGRPVNIFEDSRLEATAPNLLLNVKPLPPSPDNAPVNGVGNFTVKADYPRSNLTANQVVNIKYTISGTGNLNFVSLPDIKEALPVELKFVKSESQVKSKLTSGNMEGSVTFDVSIIPTKEGVYQLPALSFVFFSPEKGDYYIVKTQERNIKVNKGNVGEGDSNRLQFNPKLESIGELQDHPQFIIDHFPYYLMYIIPIGLLAISLLVYRRHVRITADVVGLRRRKAGSVARNRLKNSARFMRKGRSQEFYAETLKALWGYMANKLNLPVSELSRDNISEKLLEIGASEELVNKVISIIDNCEMARYGIGMAPDMKMIYNESSNVINSLEKMIPKRTMTEVNNNNFNNSGI